MNNLLIFLLLFIGCCGFYFIDYSTALIVARKDYQAFRRGELNKSLVWYYEQFTISKNKMFLIQMHISSLLNLVILPLVFGYTIKWIFDINFFIGAYLFLIVQIGASIFGTLSNLISIFRLSKNQKSNTIEELKGGVIM